ncbi:hypothetical protein OEZ86_002877 [Tetradesmus obliquus]|nr:hypothetical protein OEZ86_002877 [Tetradesmus obliquus]
MHAVTTSLCYGKMRALLVVVLIITMIGASKAARTPPDVQAPHRDLLAVQQCWERAMFLGLNVSCLLLVV